MSNTIKLRGVITNVILRETSLFMTVREEARQGANYHPPQHTVKAFPPQELRQTPEMWVQKLRHLEKGCTVIVEGKQSFEKETVMDTASNQYVAVRHPSQERDLYTPYIWAGQIDMVFDPALHTKRQHNAQQPAQQSRPPVNPQAKPTAAAQRPSDDELPPMPGADVAWN